MDDKPHAVGIRPMIDTFMVDNNGHPFAVTGKDELITTHADFKSKEVPVSIRALQRADLKDPGMVAYFTLKIGKLTPPDKFLIAHYPGTQSGWDIPAKDIGNDAAVALYWNPQEIEPGGRRQFGFAVGLVPDPVLRGDLFEPGGPDAKILADTHMGLGHGHADKRLWAQAAVAFAKSRELDPENFTAWRNHLNALAGDDNVKEHRRMCTEFLKTFGQPKYATLANGVAWLCVRFPEAVADPSEPLRFAEQAVKGDPKNADHLLILGAALYRAAQFQKSIDKLEESIKLRGKGPTELNWLFLAMANQRLGREAEAKKWLSQAVDWIEKEQVKKGPNGQLLTSWEQRLQWQLLRREAELLLKPPEKTP